MYIRERRITTRERGASVFFFVVLRGVSAGLWCVLKDTNVAFGGE